MVSIGERIKLARQLNGLTQSQLASKLGCSVSTVARWEHDRNVPAKRDMEKLVRVLDIDITEENSDYFQNELSKRDSTAVEINDLRMELVRLEKRRLCLLIVVIVLLVIAIGSIFVNLMLLNWYDPSKDNEPIRVEYFDVTEGEN